jgi:hypothetical protein
MIIVLVMLARCLEWRWWILSWDCAEQNFVFILQEHVGMIRCRIMENDVHFKNFYISSIVHLLCYSECPILPNRICHRLFPKATNECTPVVLIDQPHGVFETWCVSGSGRDHHHILELQPAYWYPENNGWFEFGYFCSSTTADNGAMDQGVGIGTHAHMVLAGF